MVLVLSLYFSCFRLLWCRIDEVWLVQFYLICEVLQGSTLRLTRCWYDLSSCWLWLGIDTRPPGHVPALTSQLYAQRQINAAFSFASLSVSAMTEMPHKLALVSTLVEHLAGSDVQINPPSRLILILNMEYWNNGTILFDIVEHPPINRIHFCLHHYWIKLNSLLYPFITYTYSIQPMQSNTATAKIVQKCVWNNNS